MGVHGAKSVYGVDKTMPNRALVSSSAKIQGKASAGPRDIPTKKKTHLKVTSSAKTDGVCTEGYASKGMTKFYDGSGTLQTQRVKALL